MESVVDNLNVAGASKQPERPIVRHSTYYIPSGDVVFRVQDTLFRVHRYFFERESPLFRDMLSLPAPIQPSSSGSEEQRASTSRTEGLSDEDPIHLPQVSSKEFEDFLWVFYNPEYYNYEAPASTWRSILRLAHRWQFPLVSNLAFRQLENEPPVSRLALGTRYSAQAKWRARAMSELATREESLNVTEGEELGVELLIEVAALREKTRAGRAGRAYWRTDRREDYYLPRSTRSRSRSRSRSPSPVPLAPVPPTIIHPLPIPQPTLPPLIIPPPPQVFEWTPPHSPDGSFHSQSTSRMRRVLRVLKNVVRKR